MGALTTSIIIVPPDLFDCAAGVPYFFDLNDGMQSLWGYRDILIPTGVPWQTSPYQFLEVEPVLVP